MLAAEFTGGLLVIQRNDDLSKVAETGERIDAELSKPLLLAIFNQYSPLHDGAVLIGEGRIRAARCILPVSDDAELPPTLGFRHRAAIGMSEVTDAAIIAISEETGRLSLATDGKLASNLSLYDLEEKLVRYLARPLT